MVNMEDPFGQFSDHIVTSEHSSPVLDMEIDENRSVDSPRATLLPCRDNEQQTDHRRESKSIVAVMFTLVRHPSSLVHIGTSGRKGSSYERRFDRLTEEEVMSRVLAHVLPARWSRNRNGKSKRRDSSEPFATAEWREQRPRHRFESSEQAISESNAQ